MLVFLALNDVYLDYSQDELIDVVLKVASGIIITISFLTGC